jgi:hypothetical protein
MLLAEFGELFADFALFLFCQAPASGTHAPAIPQTAVFVADDLKAPTADYRSVDAARGRKKRSCTARKSDRPLRSTDVFGCAKLATLVNREAFR